ncbi:hypothetical protein GQ543_00295 [candidate division WOR-3 bacterium]|jgi:signal transduction histidine kinase|nr:hypothetical protein [candidate division WOR-3 bacterium]
MASKNRRRKIILHNLQIQLIIALMGLVISISSILVISLFLIFKNNVSTLSVSEELIKQVLSDSIWPVIAIALILFIISMWAIVLITHKIYGPLHRLCAYIKKMSNGETTDDLQFRKGDAVDGLKEIYNDLRQSFEKTLHYDYEEMVKIFSELQDILDKVYNKKIQDRQLYNFLQDACDKLAKALDITSETIETDKEE